MTTADGFTALHLAVAHGQLEVMQLLLQHGASLRARTTEQIYQPVWASSGATPLHLAAARASTKLCMVLLQAYVSCCCSSFLQQLIWHALHTSGRFQSLTRHCPQSRARLQ